MNIEVMTMLRKMLSLRMLICWYFTEHRHMIRRGKAVSVDSEGNDITGELKDSARMLKGMLKQINADVQSRYSLNAPIVVELPKSKTFGNSYADYSAKIDKLKNKFRLKDNDKVMKYHDSWWKTYLTSNKQKLRRYFLQRFMRHLLVVGHITISPTKLLQLKKNYLVIQSYLRGLLSLKKKMLQNNLKKYVISIYLLKLGAEVLKNVKGFVAERWK